MTESEIIIPEVVTTPERAGALTEIIKGLQEEAKQAAEKARTFTIANAETYVSASELRNEYGERSEFAEGILRPLSSAFDKLHKRFTGMLNSTSGIFDGSAKALKAKMIVYDEEQAAIARKKQLELEAAEKKRAEEEALEVAQLLQDVGDKEAAEELLSKPVEVGPISVPKETPKVTGFSYREIWKVEVLSVIQALEDWNAGKVSFEAFKCDESYLRQEASHYKDAWIGKYKWLKVWSERV